MTGKTRFRLGIIAYGSLIDDPGQELAEITECRIECETPFKVEYARTSRTRDGAPTLIPVTKGGRSVKAMILILRDTIDFEKASTILWRRECGKINSKDVYVRTGKPTINQVIIKTITDFMNVEMVLYTSIGRNISKPITTEMLADYSINSILSKAGQEKKDGLRYLLAAKKKWN